MTDSNLSDDVTPLPDLPPIPEQPEDGTGDESGERTPEGEDTPGSPTSAEPLTDSTDGGLDGGDPGVEE